MQSFIFFLQEKIVQWRAIFCWIFWIFSEGTSLFRVNPSLYLLMASDKWCIFVLLLTILVIVSKIPRRYPSNGEAEKHPWEHRAPAKSATVMIEEIGTQNRVCTFKTWQHGSLCSQSSQNWQDALLAFVLDDVQKIQPFLLPKCTKSYFRLK